MDGYEKTPTLGLNKPEKGDFDWDLPLNENWDILDRVGGAQLPLLAIIDLDYKLSGDAAIGWALAGSTLSGNTYTSLWSAMKAAYDRSTAANETHYGKTYSVRTDAVTGWRFVTTDVYNSASSAIGDSLGHVLDTNAKIICLRGSWYTYDLPTQDTRYIGNIWDETLPNIRGELASIGNTRGNVNSSTEAIYITAKFKGQYGGGGGRAEGEESNILFNANRSNHAFSGVSPYRDNARVRPQSKNLLRYYKVGNTITNVENIDVGTILSSISDMVHANEFVETKRIVTATWRSGNNWYTKYSDGWIEQGGDTVAINADSYTVTLNTPFQETSYYVNWIINGNTNDVAYAHTTEKTTKNFIMRDYLMNNLTASWYACGY
mgnify:CR=1 FL=1|jgi:hypothetical protein